MKGSLRSWRFVFLACAFFLLASIVPGASGMALSAIPGAELEVKTDDGAVLPLRRYLPESGMPFNEGALPVILMPGAGANINEFDLRSPEGKIYGVKLPEVLPDWARGDEVIQRDPIKFYSLAYFLYSRGFDVWLTRYRACADSSGGGFPSWNSSIDHYGIYDVAAVVKKVRQVTGRKPIYIGHSMGATMAYIYLQGAVFRGLVNPRVVSVHAKAIERNNGSGPEAIRGFVDLDGPIVPSIKSCIPSIAFLFLLPESYLNVGGIDPSLAESLAEIIILMERILWALKDCLPDFLDNIVAAIRFVNPANIDINVMRFYACYVGGGLHTHAMAQYSDSIKWKKLREYYRNGLFRRFTIFPPAPCQGDGYYYYSDNMQKITLPSLVLADATLDLTDPEDIKSFYLRKGRHPLDEFYVMRNTAHLDLVNGLLAPYETFPVIYRWLVKLSG